MPNRGELRSGAAFEHPSDARGIGPCFRDGRNLLDKGVCLALESLNRRFGCGIRLRRAGYFSGFRARINYPLRCNELGLFAASDSMEPLVPKDSWCLFKPYEGGSREGRNLLVTHQSISEIGFPIRTTLKRYHSEKVVDKLTGEWRHTKVVLKPLNPAHDEIEIAEREGDDGTGAVRVVAELVCVL